MHSPNSEDTRRGTKSFSPPTPVLPANQHNQFLMHTFRDYVYTHALTSLFKRK